MAPALSVANMASGSVLLEMDDAELKALWTSPGGGLRALSSRLTVATGCPRFRQRLFCEGDPVADESVLLSPCALQLVLLPQSATASKQREEELLHLCHDPNMLVPYGRSALHALTVAAINGNCDCLRLLLEAEADVDVSKASGLTSLQWAARKGHVEASQLLVSAMADVDKADGTPTALQLAAKCGHVEIVASLLQARANPDKKAWGGVQGAPTALQQASENGHLQIVRLLVDAGADKEAAGPVDSGMTPLGWACYWGHSDICRLLVEARASVNSSGEKGSAPLLHASGHGHLEIARLLVEAGAEALVFRPRLVLTNASDEGLELDLKRGVVGTPLPAGQSTVYHWPVSGDHTDAPNCTVRFRPTSLASSGSWSGKVICGDATARGAAFAIATGQASLPKQAGKQTAEMWTAEVSPTRGAVAVTFKKSSDFVAINRSARLGVCMEVRPKGLEACLSNFVVRAGEEVQYGWSEPHEEGTNSHSVDIILKTRKGHREEVTQHEVRDVRRTEHFVFPELGLTLLLGQTGTGSVLSLEDLKEVRRSGQESVSNKGTTNPGQGSTTHLEVKISKAGISIIEEKPPPGQPESVKAELAQLLAIAEQAKASAASATATADGGGYSEQQRDDGWCHQPEWTSRQLVGVADTTGGFFQQLELESGPLATSLPINKRACLPTSANLCFLGDIGPPSFAHWCQSPATVFRTSHVLAGPPGYGAAAAGNPVRWRWGRSLNVLVGSTEYEAAQRSSVDGVQARVPELCALCHAWLIDFPYLRVSIAHEGPLATDRRVREDKRRCTLAPAWPCLRFEYMFKSLAPVFVRLPEIPKPQSLQPPRRQLTLQF
eukprot:s118_g3.t2